MRDIQSVYGQVIKSDKDLIMFVGSPGSDEIQVLPAGRPSPTIRDYLPNGYFGVNGSEIGYKVNLYIKDSDSIRIVPEGAKDESTFYSRLNNGLFTTWWNTSGYISKNLGFLGEGARQSFTDLKLASFDVAKYANRLLILLIVFMFLWFINKLT